MLTAQMLSCKGEPGRTGTDGTIGVAGDPGEQGPKGPVVWPLTFSVAGKTK